MLYPLSYRGMREIAAFGLPVPGARVFYEKNTGRSQRGTLANYNASRDPLTRESETVRGAHDDDRCPGLLLPHVPALFSGNGGYGRFASYNGYCLGRTHASDERRADRSRPVSERSGRVW